MNHLHIRICLSQSEEEQRFVYYQLLNILTPTPVDKLRPYGNFHMYKGKVYKNIHNNRIHKKEENPNAYQ